MDNLNIQNSQPDFQPEADKKSPSKIALVLGILAVLVIGIIGIWYFVNQNKNQVPNTPVVNLKESIPVQGQSADWQVYKNEEFGFEFKYPKNLSYVESPGGYSDNSVLFRNENEVDSFNFGIAPVDFLNNKMSMTETFSEKIINNIRVVYFDYEGITAYFFGKDNLIHFSKKIGLSKGLFDQILSTFKFIDGFADWQVYINDKFRFQFKHPAYLHYKSEQDINGITEIMFVNGAGFDELKIRIELGHKTIAETFSPFLLTLMQNVTTINDIPAFEIKAAEATARTIHLFGTNFYITITKLNLSNDLVYFDDLISTFDFVE